MPKKKQSKRRNPKRGPSAVRERCEGPGLLQAGIDPDTPAGRNLVTQTLGWVWVDRVDSGVWDIRPPQEWRDQTDLDATLSDGELEVRITVEWP